MRTRRGVCARCLIVCCQIALFFDFLEAGEWPITAENGICRHHFAVSGDGRVVIYQATMVPQAPLVKGPPPPPNATISAFRMMTGQLQWLGGRDTTRSWYPNYLLPGPGGRWAAAHVDVWPNPEDRSDEPQRVLYIVDTELSKSHQIASDVETSVWDRSDGTLVVSFRETNGLAHPVRRYDTQADGWTDVPVHGQCLDLSDDGQTGLYQVVAHSPDNPASKKAGATRVYALIDRQGRIVQVLSDINAAAGRPILSPSARFVAVKQTDAMAPGRLGYSVGVYTSKGELAGTVAGNFELIEVTERGDLVLLDFDAAVQGGRTLRRTQLSGRHEVLAENVSVASSNGSEVFYITEGKNPLLRSLNLDARQGEGDTSGPVNLFGTTEQGMTERSFDKFLEKLGLGEPSSTDAAFRLSEQQKMLQQRLGNPPVFTISFIEETFGEKTVKCRSEKWVYPAAQTTFSFLDGECIGTEQLPARARLSRSTVHHPASFVEGMSMDDLKARLGSLMMEELHLKDTEISDPFLRRISLFASDDLLLGFLDGKLVTVKCLPQVSTVGE